MVSNRPPVYVVVAMMGAFMVIEVQLLIKRYLHFFVGRELEPRQA